MASAPNIERVVISAAGDMQQAVWAEHAPEGMATVPVVHTIDVLRAATSAATHCLSFLLIRLGDTETAVLEHPDLTDWPVNVRHAGWPLDWHMTDMAIMDLAATYGDVLRDADAVGMIWSEWESTARIARAVARCATGPVRAVCSTLGYREWVGPYMAELQHLVHGRHVLCVGAKAAEWHHVVAALGAIAHPWPYDRDPCIETTQDLDAVLAWATWVCEPCDPMTVALVGVGPWALPLCHRLWQAGIVALDLGAGLTTLPDALPLWINRLLDMQA